MTNNTDLISRQAAIDAINRLSIHDFAYEVKTGWIVRDDAVDELRQLPSITPKQRTGHWIIISPTDMYCSECNEIEHLDTSRRFCAYCGTRMVEPQESDDKESCDTCKHNAESWESDACDGCCGANSKWSGESYPGEFEAMEHNGRLDALESEEISGEEIAALLARGSAEITREEAINMLKSKMDGHTDTSYEWAETVRMAIKALEQEPKTGHWIECEDEVKCFCSECKEISDYPTKFCPNCGARMVEPQERNGV